MRITRSISIDESELDIQFVRSPGPGGQNVNKVATACVLRFDVAGSDLPEDVKRRLAVHAGRRLTDEGVLILQAHRYRTQKRNRDDALHRLAEMICAAAIPPKQRTPTRPTLASKRRRLDAKKRRGQVKRLRKPPTGEP